MNPEDQNLVPQNQMPGQQPAVPAGGSSWQQQALAAAQAGAHAADQQPAPAPAPTAAAAPIPGVPAWQQEFRRQPAPPADQGVPDMLAAADPQPSAVPHPLMPAAQPAPPQPQMPQSGVAAGQAVVSGSFGEDIAAVPVTGTGGPSFAKKLPVVIIMLVVLAAAAAGAYYFFFLRGSHKSVNKATQQSINTSPGIDLSLLNTAQLALADQSGLTKDITISTDTITALTIDSNQKCSLTYGTGTAKDLPGDTIDAIVNHQIDLIKGLNAAVSGPTSGDALVLRSGIDKSKEYKLATLNFKLSKDQSRITSHYSIAITKDGTRVIVTRACYATDGRDIPDSTLAPLEDIAKKITVQVGT